MLRQSHNKSSSHLNRRKSTSSIYTTHDSIDPEIARQYAHAAAKYAFARARQRESADLGRSQIQNRSHSVSNKEDYMARETDSILPDDHTIKRQQSVRFAGPTVAVRGGIRPRIGVESKPSSGSLRPRALTNNVSVPAECRPPSRSSSIGKTSIGKGAAASYATALAAYNEYYAREDDAASTPSSYRRLRRTKSMLSPIKMPNLLFNNGTPHGEYHIHGGSEQPEPPSRPDSSRIRIQKSMSFLRGGREHMTTALRQDHDNAVNKARDKFLHSVEQQRLREQPSFLFRSKARRQEKPFRHSLRSDSIGNFGVPVASLNQGNQPKDSYLKIKARKASLTIKNKLKGLFKRSSGDLEGIIPDQQIESQNPHISSYLVISEAAHGDWTNIPHPDNATISRVASRQPSIHAVLSHDQLRSRTGSVQSQQSDHSGKSQVTSWTNTEKDTTTGSRFNSSEKERQRLSIIQENGTHISSSSMHRPKLSNQYSAYPVIRKATDFQTHPLSPRMVDSQKVYTALMKRLEENSPQAKLAQRMASIQQLGPPKYIPPRTSSVNSSRSSHASETPRTIRKVSDEPNPLYMSNKNQKNIYNGDDVFASKNPTDSATATNGNRYTDSDSTIFRKPSHTKEVRVTTGVEGVGLTPQELALQNEPVIPQFRGIRETRSTFFGTSSFDTITRTTSPYRRAKQAEAENEANQAAKIVDARMCLSPAVLFATPATATIASLKVMDLDSREKLPGPYTESVYSRTTSGQTPVLGNSTASLPLVEHNFPLNNTGSIVVVDRSTYQPLPTTHRITPSIGSTEWKSWMSAQVSTLEKAKDNDLQKINYAMPSMPRSFGHVRESAQINDEPTEVPVRKPSRSKQPLGIVHHNIPPKPILKHRRSSSLVEIPRLPPPPPPPLPELSPIRPAQSRTSLRSGGTPNTMRIDSAPPSVIKGQANFSRQLLHSRSNLTIRSADTPAKLIKKHGRPLNQTVPSPGISLAVEKQFGSAGPKTPYFGMENRYPTGSDEQYCPSGVAAQLDPQAMGSRRMIDLFLSSRRSRMTGSDEDAFI